MADGDVLCRIEAKHFCAGIIARNGRVVDAAPIVIYKKNWTGREVANYCKAKGWKVVRVDGNVIQSNAIEQTVYPGAPAWRDM